jgi:hypothetical protein
MVWKVWNNSGKQLEWSHSVTGRIVFIRNWGTDHYLVFVADRDDERGKPIKKGAFAHKDAVKIARDWMKAHPRG